MSKDIRCQTCNKAIKTKVFWQKFCSQKCRLIAWVKKQEAQANDK